MFPLRSVLLLSASLSQAITNENEFVVTQTSDLVVAAGDTVQISCCWLENLSQQSRVKWVRKVANWSTNTSDGVGSGSCANLTLPNVTSEDRGRYFCEVTLQKPVYRWSKGNGTLITLKERQNTSLDLQKEPERRSHTFEIPLGVSVSVAVAMVAFVVALRALRKRRDSDRAARVIYEVPHRGTEPDGQSTSSSRGSSQWCKVPVYESFDYFEPVVENKGTR